MAGVTSFPVVNDASRRTFLDGSTRSYARLPSAAVGYGTYAPGWRWSAHAGPQTNRPAEKHVGYVLAGTLMIQDAQGSTARVEAGCAFEIEAGGDAWVVGETPCAALDFIPLQDAPSAWR